VTAAATLNPPSAGRKSASRSLLVGIRSNPSNRVNPRTPADYPYGVSSGDGEGSQEHPLRRFTWEVADSYRPQASPGVCDCCHKRIAEDVRFDKRGDRVFIVGVLTCHKIWECPVCGMRIRAARAKELEHVITWHRTRWGEQSAWMLTLTVRHALGHDLRQMRKGLAQAWGRFITGGAWQAMKKQLGYVGMVRALEVTHGPHGWHPHLHILFLTQQPAPEDFRRWAHARWAEAVDRELGHEHAPTMDGVFVSHHASADYALKMGIRLTVELISTGSKEGRGAPDGELRRTPLRILADWAQRGRDPADLVLYRAYVEGMSGAKMLTWSVGLRKRAKLAEISDEMLLEGEPAGPDDAPRERIAVIPGAEWDRVRRIPGAKAALCDIAGRWGAKGLYFALDVLLEGAPLDELGERKRRYDPAEMDILLQLPGSRGFNVRTV
jgi:hypothetical protein